MPTAAVIGASVGGLVAAAELKEQGWDVTLFEAGATGAGLYGKVETPFGPQELGMHVLYLSDRHHELLSGILGAESFETWTGTAVDVAGHHNFGQTFFNTGYPDLRGRRDCETIRRELLSGSEGAYRPASAHDAVTQRFGHHAGEHVFAPILKKLWRCDPNTLAAGAIHCFYDLRRVVLWDKDETDHLKQNAWLDQIVANPDQSRPATPVFGGRRAARLRSLTNGIGTRIEAWAARSGTKLELGKRAIISDDKLLVDGTAVDEAFDACIVATPASMLLPDLQSKMDLVELSIFYLQLEDRLAAACPSYYILVHDERFLSARIVNYEAYQFDRDRYERPVIAVEVIHPVGQRPSVDRICAEVKSVLPTARVADNFVLPNSLKVPAPTIRNGHLLDAGTTGVGDRFAPYAFAFAGMRTDKGIFFSHHTIGRAHEAAVDCARAFA